MLMTKTTQPIRTAMRALALSCAALLCAACAHRPAPGNAMPFEQAVNQAVDDLIVQTQKLPAFLAKVESSIKQSRIVIDPLLEGASGQQTEVTRVAEQRIVQRMQSQFKQFTVTPFNNAEIERAQYVLNGTLVRDKDSADGRYRLNLALTEIKSGMVIAQSVARISDATLDTRPTAFFRDSPVNGKDRGVEGYIRTAETQPGQAADALYLERLPTSTVLQEATAAYEAGRMSEALSRYEAASRRPDGQQLRIYSGLYLTQAQLGRTADAEKTFGTLARLGLETNNLSVKFLFKPGSTDFLADPKISAAYPMWLRQIARQAAQIDSCVVVTGHTSRTGSESVNERLSLQRALSVKTRLVGEAPPLSKKLRESGMGFRENIVGTGADDASDALDRRVEFKVASCEA
ncbi:OmpA family protein [Variovorax paradoxus]|jgi:outer membrane protein OmpA-like peptidoglycan-associated protein|uniref:OmpA family protein n=1 Tax=Variovorax paradoxus TaxID=34073 RepID=UPI0029C7C446|nr:OmpA family protein [Variovorax paradoxus]WPH19155.1 OmpA family protein [Variovorax paradoxus]